MENSALPTIMANARVDLAATVEGYFSHEDWDLILKRAEQQWREYLSRAGADEQSAWEEVIRDFIASRYWGYQPKRQRPPSRKPKNLGLQLIWLGFNSLTVTKVAVLWFGQIYSRSDEPRDKWIFFLVLILVFGNYLYFLWRNHAHPD